MAGSLGSVCSHGRHVPVIAVLASCKVKSRPPNPWSFVARARLLDAVGARDDQRRRDGRGFAKLIADKSGDVDFFAAAIDAALGIHVGVDRPRGVTAFDSTIGKIEGVEGQIEEGVFASRLFPRRGLQAPSHLRPW